MREIVKLRQMIDKMIFLKRFQQKENIFENLKSGCHGNVFVTCKGNVKFYKILSVSKAHDMQERFQ